MVELGFEFCFDLCEDFAVTAGLFAGEEAVLPASGFVGFPFAPVPGKEGFNFVYGVVERFVLQFTFPYSDDVPGEGFETMDIELVPFLVPADFFGPEFHVGLGNGVELAASVSVPETSVDEYGCPVAGKYDVRGAGQSTDVDAEAVSAPPQFSSDSQLGAGVPGMYA